MVLVSAAQYPCQFASRAGGPSSLDILQNTEFVELGFRRHAEKHCTTEGCVY